MRLMLPRMLCEQPENEHIPYIRQTCIQGSNYCLSQKIKVDTRIADCLVYKFIMTFENVLGNRVCLFYDGSVAALIRPGKTVDVLYKNIHLENWYNILVDVHPSSGRQKNSYSEIILT